jgi:hypothetical protein
LVVFRAAARRAGLPRALTFRATFRVIFFFRAGDFVAAFLLRADFFLVAIVPPVYELLSAEPQPPC